MKLLGQFEIGLFDVGLVGRFGNTQDIIKVAFVARRRKETSGRWVGGGWCRMMMMMDTRISTTTACRASSSCIRVRVRLGIWIHQHVIVLSSGVTLARIQTQTRTRSGGSRNGPRSIKRRGRSSPGTASEDSRCDGGRCGHGRVDVIDRERFDHVF
jgi:hypothetical protein